MEITNADGIREHVALMDIDSVAQAVLTVLGPSLVGALTGTSDRSLPGQWSRPFGAEPSAAAAARLRHALVQWLRLTAAEDADLARTWILDTHPQLDGATVISALRADRFDQIDATVTEYLATLP